MNIDEVKPAFMQENGKGDLTGIHEWMTYYNSERPHSSLGDKTPAEAYLKLVA